MFSYKKSTVVCGSRKVPFSITTIVGLWIADLTTIGKGNTVRWSPNHLKSNMLCKGKGCTKFSFQIIVSTIGCVHGGYVEGHLDLANLLTVKIEPFEGRLGGVKKGKPNKGHCIDR